MFEEGVINIYDARKTKLVEEEGKWTSHQFGEVTIYRLELPLEDQDDFDISRFLTVHEGKLVWGTVAEEGEKVGDHLKYFNKTAIQDITSNFNP